MMNANQMHMTSDQFFMEFDNAQPGRAIVYHVGMLSNARRVPDVHRLAHYAMTLQKDGRAELFQRRLGNFHYEYLAVKR